MPGSPALAWVPGKPGDASTARGTPQKNVRT
jgi:hypothetical protein